MFEAFNEDKFDFETWAELAKTDPAAFEEKRKALMQEVIEQSPDKYKQRLEGIQFQVDGQRQIAKNPIDSMQRIYGMMMDKVFKEDGLLHALESLSKPQQTKPIVTRKRKDAKADVVSFRKETAEA